MLLLSTQGLRNRGCNIVVKENAIFRSYGRRFLKSAFKNQTGHNSFRLDRIKKHETNEAHFIVKN